MQDPSTPERDPTGAAAGGGDPRAFVARYPTLFHVTRRSAIDGIARRGLRTAASLAGDPGEAQRREWTRCPGPDGAPVWLRWQRLRDQVLEKRLPATITPGQWRRFINTMVFFSPSLADARRLRAFPLDARIDQVILEVRSAALIEAGCALRLCRWNNGFPDRTVPLRQRGYDDYRPVGGWRRGDVVREVTVEGDIPAGVRFRLASD